MKPRDTGSNTDPISLPGPHEASSSPTPAQLDLERRQDESDTPAGTAGQARQGPPLGMPEIPGYEMLGELARGGMGIVYKARQQDLNRIVALKVIRAGANAGEAERARFRTEARAVAGLQHPYVVQIYEVGEHEGLLFLCLEYCSGGSLADNLGSGPLPPEQAARLMEQIAQAVHAAHQRGIIHRDLKPANVLLFEDGTPRVADFGLAKRLDEQGQTPPRAVLGTPSYLAPEQAGGQSGQVGPAADIHALGAIFYECLTGRPPYKAASALETLRQVMRSHPLPPRKLNGSVPRELETICLKCLEKNPARRYPTAEALADDLARWQASEPISIHPTGPLGCALRWVRRKPTAALLALLVVLIGGLIVLRPGEPGGVSPRGSRARPSSTPGANAPGLAPAENWERRTILERALRLCKQGQVNQGLLWLTRGLETAHSAGATDLEQVFRWELGAWSQEGRRLQQTLPHPNGVRALAFSPDGSRLLTGSVDQFCRVWDSVRGELIGVPLRQRGQVQGLAFGSDGKIAFGLSSLGDQQLYRWDLARREPLGCTGGQDGEPWRLALDRTGTYLVTGSRARSAGRIWDARTGKILPALLQHESGDVLAVAIRPDGKAVLTGGEDRTLRLWELPSGNPIGPPIRHSASIVAVAFNADGKRVLTGSQDRTLQQWDSGDWKPLGPPLRHQGTVNGVAFVPGTPLLASGSDDNSARFWFAPTGDPVGPALQHTDRVTAVALPADGGMLATASDDSTARIWTVPRPVTEEPAQLAGWVEAITGLKLDRNGTVRALPAADWHDRQKRFLPLPSLDPAGQEVLTPASR